jgi:hypothetical protein
MKADADYSALVSQAEKAVSGVKDAELRRIAFQKILENLLGGSASPVTRHGSHSRKLQ